MAPPRRRFQHGKVQAVHLHHPAAAGLARRSAAPRRTGSNHCPRWCRQAAPPPPPPPPPQVGATTRWVPPPHPAFHRLRLRLLFLLCRRGGPASVGWHGRDRAFLLDGRVGPQRASDGRGGTGLSSLMTASTSIDCFGVMPILARPQSSALSNSVYLSSALSAAALAEEAARWVLSTLCALHAAQPPPVPLGGWVECLECETRPRGTRGTRWRALARFDPAAAAARLWG